MSKFHSLTKNGLLIRLCCRNLQTADGAEPLARPVHCPDELYKTVLLRCWDCTGDRALTVGEVEDQLCAVELRQGRFVFLKLAFCVFVCMIIHTRLNLCLPAASFVNNDNNNNHTRSSLTLSID